MVEDQGFPLRQRVNARLDTLIAKFYEEVPYVTHFVKGDDIDLEYYKRHNIETVLRIRRKRTVDAWAIRYFTLHDPRAAARWCKYAEEEMLHDEMFMQDLSRMGLTREDVYGSRPMLSTELMMGYLLNGLEYDGTPLALLTSVYLIEYVTVLTQPRWLDHVGDLIGDQNVEGARAHVSTDIDDKHADFVWDVLCSLVKSEADERRLFEHINGMYSLWAMYFTELYDRTVAASADSPKLARV